MRKTRKDTFKGPSFSSLSLEITSRTVLIKKNIKS